MSTLKPAPAAVTANAAVTVVFPTPPLPATMTTWEVEQKCATSIPACYERPMRSPHVRVRAGAAAVLTLLAVGLWAATAGAQPQPPATVRASGLNGIVVVQVNGLIDPSNAALITTSLRDAANARASLLVFQLDGSGAV